jgi:hypothetical protein
VGEGNKTGWSAADFIQCRAELGSVRRTGAGLHNQGTAAAHDGRHDWPVSFFVWRGPKYPFANAV